MWVKWFSLKFVACLVCHSQQTWKIINETHDKCDAHGVHQVPGNLWINSINFNENCMWHGMDASIISNKGSKC